MEHNGVLHMLPKIQFDDVDVEHRKIFLDLSATLGSESPVLATLRTIDSDAELRCERYYRAHGVSGGLSTSESDPAHGALRSAEELLDCVVSVRDGDLGRVIDLVMDDDTWQVSYLVVETTNDLRRNVIINPHWADEVDWQQRQVHLDLNSDTIERMSEV